MSAFLAVATAWFAVMEIVLRHPGYTVRGVVACLLCFLSLKLWQAGRRSAPRISWPVTSAALAAGGLGIYAFLVNAWRQDFEGYIALISLALVTQAVLVVLARSRTNA